MTRVRLIQLGVVSVAAIAISAAKAHPPVNAIRACDATSPHASAFISSANTTFTHLDAARSSRFGWKSAPSSVTLVTTAGTCDAVLAAHNTFVDGKYAAYRVSSAAIGKADNSYLVDVPPGGPSEELIFVYDSAMKFKAIY